MGRVTQFLDFINRDPKDFSTDLIAGQYTHVQITEEMKKVRKEYRRNLKKK